MSPVLFIFLAVLAFLQIVFWNRDQIGELEYFSYGKAAWRNISSNCTCPDGSRNCYPHPADPNLCGKCFSSCGGWGDLSLPGIVKSKEHCFALSATQADMNKVLVLIASIHKHYPQSKILIYNDEKSTVLQHQMISIRNVQVINREQLRTVADPFVTPFYLRDALQRHENVVWLSKDLEFLSPKLDMQARTWPSPVTFIGYDSFKKVLTAGFREYFPSAESWPSAPLAVHLKQELNKFINWALKCVSEDNCWKCTDAASTPIDCTMILLGQLAAEEEKFKHKGIPKKTLELQSWSAPECDLLCTIYFTGLTTIALFIVCLLVLLMISGSLKKVE